MSRKRARSVHARTPRGDQGRRRARHAVAGGARRPGRENDRPAVVESDATTAAASAPPIAIPPFDTRATALLKGFFDGKACALCDRAIPHVGMGDPKPGLVNPVSHEVLAWEAIPACDLPAVLRAHLPICSNCETIETFSRQHPDRVVDRKRLRLIWLR